MPSERSTTATTVITHNIGDSTGHLVPVERVVGLYRNGRLADVIVMQEVRSQGQMLALRRDLRRRSGRDYDFVYCNRISVGILSVRAFSVPRVFVAPSSPLRYGAFAVTVGSGADAIDIVGVHLDPVRKSRDRHGFSAALGLVVQLVEEVIGPTVRSRMAREIHAWVSRWSSNPVIIAGDFNTVPSSTTGRFMRRHYHDALHHTCDYRSGTYWKIHGPKPRVDFIFHSARLKRLDACVIREEAGDHYPVLARFRSRASGP
ncbi:MAG: endonuclease/exonuclease/phosphatase family protein [Spirochaetota bacterium]